MRKKLLLVFTGLWIMAGCSLASTSENLSKSVNSVTDYLNGSTGIIYVATLIEIKSNFSSLLYDKTKAKKENFYEFVYAKIGKDAVLHVLPVKVITPYETYYDTSSKTILTNYIVINKFGKVTENNQENDFFVMATVKESLQTSFGQNMSHVEITIVDRDNIPYFFTQIEMVSKSDKNFWYYPQKEAKPVSYLTLNGFNYILQSSLNKAFQES